jgi:hypothetical protein
MSLVFDGRKVDIPGVTSVDFLDDPKYHIAKKGWKPRPENMWIRGIVLHTRMGMVSTAIHREPKNNRWDEVLPRRWELSERYVGCHIAIDSDGSYSCMADIIKTQCHHAGQVNPVTVGIEIYQGGNGSLYIPAIETAVKIVDVLTRELGIQRMFPTETGLSYRIARDGKRPWRRTRRLAWHKDGRRGLDFAGIYGHRNATGNRGYGDPGDEIFAELAAVGYESYSIDDEDDRKVWSRRQQQIGATADGIPGPKTRAALEGEGFIRGQWIYRQGDIEE